MPAGPRFDLPPLRDGYAWWYIDGVSDDHRYGLTLIAMLGNVFSPYYARARRRGAADPLDHCAMNVALYGASGHRWAMTERGVRMLKRTEHSLGIGPSRMSWSEEGLLVEIDELTVPWPSVLRGQVRVRPVALPARSWTIDPHGRHHWTPHAPLARLEVEFERPALRWCGDGYFDANWGEVPLERDFRRWTWSRSVGSERTVVFYDVDARTGAGPALGLEFLPDGRVRDIGAPPMAPLPPGLWRVQRSTRCDAGATPRVRETLEDAPFYVRSLVDTQVHGQPMPAMHESLDLDRFDARWVQALLPFRMPRRAGR